MSKAARAKRRSEQDKVRVNDAVRLMRVLHQTARLTRAPHTVNQGDRWVGGVATEMLDLWNETRIVLRADAEFVGALVDTPDDVEIARGWMNRLPYASVAVILAECMPLFDGDRWCRYVGFLATGIRTDRTNSVRSRHASAPDVARLDDSLAMTQATTLYGPLNGDAGGFRVLWAFEGENGDVDGAQTVSVHLDLQPDGKVQTIGQLKAWTSGCTRCEVEGRRPTRSSQSRLPS